MTATVIYLQHVLVPQNRKTVHRKLCSIKAAAPKWDRPFVALLNGEAVLRKDWNTRLRHQDTLAFIDANAFPQGGGGGGSSPLKTILMIAVMVMAPWAGAYLGVMTGIGTAAMWSGVAMMAGMMLVNALIPPPKPTTAQQAAALAAPSPTYDLQAQGNSARIEAAIPEHFGRHIVYPDYAAQPYIEYHGQEQYIYCLLCIGRGEYALEGIKIEDTPITSFPNIDYQVVPPFGSVNLFPVNVVTSVEVAGQDLPFNTWVGPFVVNPPGTTCNYIGVDIVMPRGLYYANDDGSLQAMTVIFIGEKRLIDDAGNPLGAWTGFAYADYNGATTTPIRQTERYIVPSGRYEVRLKRNDTEQTGTRYGHDMVWAGLRAYTDGATSYGDMTFLAMRMQASNSLSQQSSRKINVVATRKLPIWNGATWGANTATRSPAWAIAYACKQVGLLDAQIDLAALLTLDATWAARGDYFDARFDNFISFWEAVTKIAGAGRAKPYMQGGIMRIMRDQQATIPTTLFSMRNIIKGSFKVDYLMPTVDTADAVDVGYFDSGQWAPKRVRAKLPDSSANRPAKVELFGVTGRDHAFREGMYQAAANRYRRKIIYLATEMEGFIPSFGELIAIQHDMPAWGQGGEVTAWNAGTLTATLSEPPVWATGTHYMALRKRDGGIDGPYAVTAGAAANEVIFSTAPTITPYVGGNEERTHYTFGWATTWSQKARVLSTKPRSLTQIDIIAVNEDNNVHTAEIGAITPAAPTSQLVSYTNKPVVSQVTVAPMPFAPNKMLISWRPAPWAQYYVMEQSQDGIRWTSIGTTSGSNYTATRLYGSSTQVRVAAYGMSMGPWTTATIAATPVPTDVPTFTATVVANGILLSWASTTDSYFLEYELKQGGTSWGDAVSLGRFRTTEYKVPPLAAGNYIWRVKKIDDTGQFSANDKTTSLLITVPQAPTNVRAQVIDNNVLLYWEQPTSQQAIGTYQIIKDGTPVGTKSGLFTSLFETIAGDFVYGVAAVDIAGNIGVITTVAASVNQPPDYVLHANYISTFSTGGPVIAATLSNADLTSGSVVLPVNTTETFAQHFTNNGWATPDAQIAAGFPTFAQPPVSSGYYEETIDYGTVLAANMITVALNSVILVGAPTTVITISTKKLIGDAWTDFVGASSIFATDFRYVKIKVVVTSNTTGLLHILGLTTRLDAKLKSDAGNVACVSTDNSAAINSAAIGGTTVLFNTAFTTVTSITMTVQGTTGPITALYDFIGATINPLGFKVYLFNSAGARVSGTVSWSVKGY